MTIRNLEFFFKPRSIALIGASNRLHSVGGTVLRNLLAGNFAGRVMPVNPNHRTLAGVDVYLTVANLPVTPDLAVICTPPATVPALVEALATRGTRAVIVISAGFGAKTEDGRSTLREAMLVAARPSLTRILGPNCVGLLVPAIGLNASFAHTNALLGGVAR